MCLSFDPCAFANLIMECGCPEIELDLISHNFGCITAIVSITVNTITPSGLYSSLDLSSWLCRFRAVDFSLGPLGSSMIEELRCNCPRLLVFQDRVCYTPIANSDSSNLYSNLTSFELRPITMTQLICLPFVSSLHFQFFYYNVQF